MSVKIDKGKISDERFILREKKKSSMHDRIIFVDFISEEVIMIYFYEIIIINFL
jgi:hypothetical protein